jgi:hypothetical protein
VIRVLPAALLGAAILLAAGCSREPVNYEVIIEVTGTQGTVVTTMPGGKPGETVKDVTLPWKGGYVVESPDAKKGLMTVQVTPAKGAATCRIEVEGKQIVKKVGKEGEALKCEADIIKG